MLKRLLTKIKKSYMDMKLSTKILTFYSGVLLFSVVLSAFIYQNVYNSTMSKKVSEVSVQTLYSISSNILSMIENAKNLSKVVITSDEIQQPLNQISETPYPKDYTEYQRIMNTYISRFIEAFPFISSIYIYDSASQRYGIDKMHLKTLKIPNISMADWYESAVDAKGGFILKLNAGGIYEDSDEETYISLIRIINDIYTQKPLGVLIMNITESSFVNSYADILNKYKTDIMILDEEGHTVVDFRNNQPTDIVNSLLYSEHEDGSNSMVGDIDGRKYLVSLLNMQKYNWSIISVMPFDELSKESAIFNITAISIIVLNAALMFMGAVAISRMIATPIKKLLEAMKGVEHGDFKKVEIDTGDNEIGSLRDAYNIMITEIQHLIDKVVTEEKIKRKAELDVLQAQIKPHFLYNTFDSISSLALSGKSEQVYKVMKSLGSYYRVSLSKGSEVITVAEEIDVVRNYMAIQQVRYGDIFTMHYDIDESATKYRILKLILQPLVENSLYHGIKPKGEHGNIYIRCKQRDEFIELIVEDDGVGVSKETIAMILDNRYSMDTKSSFGLRGTIERLRIFYGIKDPVFINSALGSGTTVTIHIPIERSEQHA
ncbi:MAG: cache domain-containing sensor histidine kinase [Acetivibrionales bacterium]|jgi:two-component system sensor histidine kinase YesM